MVNFSVGFVAATTLSHILVASGLQSADKGFFGDVARLALTGAQQALTSPGTTSFGNIARDALGNVLGIPQALPETQQAPPPPPSLNLPELDEKKARVIDTRERLLRQRLDKAAELKQKIAADLQYMKEKGLLQQSPGTAALRAAAPQTADLAEAFEQYEAPVIFLEPPPITPKQEMDASESAEAALHMAGDETSPVMKAVKDYNEAKLGRVSATTLEEVRREIKKTESDIKKRKLEREELYDKLKHKGRELAKTGSRRMRAEASFTNNDLKEKDKEIEILSEKLLTLKKREASLIKKGRTEEGEGEAGEMKEEDMAGSAREDAEDEDEELGED